MTYDRNVSPGYLTNLAARLFVRALERRIAGSNAGPMPVFIALQHGGSLSQKELVQHAAVEQPTMAATLNRMERDGLIVRTPDARDGRSSLVSLTPLGRQRADAALSAAFEVSAIASDALKPGEAELYYDMLRRIIAVLERDGEAG